MRCPLLSAKDLRSLFESTLTYTHTHTPRRLAVACSCVHVRQLGIPHAALSDSMRAAHIVQRLLAYASFKPWNERPQLDMDTDGLTWTVLGDEVQSSLGDVKELVLNLCVGQLGPIGVGALICCCLSVHRFWNMPATYHRTVAVLAVPTGNCGPNRHIPLCCPGSAPATGALLSRVESAGVLTPAGH